MSAASGAACGVCGGGVEDCACLLQRRGMRCGVADLNRGFPGMFLQARAGADEEPTAAAAAAVDVVGGGGGGAGAPGLQEFQFFGQEDHESVAWLFNDHAPVGGEDRLQHRPAATEHQQRGQAFDAYADYQPGHGLTFDVPVPLSRAEAAVLGLGGGNTTATSGASIVSDAILRERNVTVHRQRRGGELRRRPERRRGVVGVRQQQLVGRPERHRSRRWRRRTTGGGTPGGEAAAVQGEAEASAVREADPVRVPQGLRRDAAARQGPLRQGARRRRPKRRRRTAADAGRRRLRPRPARPRMVPFVANTSSPKH